MNFCQCDKDKCNEAVDLAKARKCYQCSSKENGYKCDTPKDIGNLVDCDTYCAIAISSMYYFWSADLVFVWLLEMIHIYFFIQSTKVKNTFIDFAITLLSLA